MTAAAARRTMMAAVARPFIIVDPNLRDVVGHYFEYDRAVAAAAAECGYQPIILGHRDIETGIARRIGADPVFTRDIWGLAKGGGGWPARAWARVRDNARFLRELVGAMRCFDMPPGSVVFVHTFIDRQFLALALLPLLAGRRRDTRYVFLLRYQPSFYQDPLSTLAFRLIERLARRYAIHLTTDSGRLADQLGRLTYAPIHVLPIPHCPPDPPAGPGPPAAATTTFVSMGNARDEKGILEILDAIRILHGRGQLGGMRFVLQCNDAAPEIRAAIDGFAEQAIPGCTLLREKLDSGDYHQALWGADVVLLPYWRSIYAARTSGVFMEALSAGKPVITTADTWMSDQLADYGAGLRCRDRSPEALAATIRRAAAQREALAASARADRQRWVKTHNPHALVEAIEALAEAPVPVASPPRNALILYPHHDFLGRFGGASRRVGLLADFLGTAGLRVRVLQGGQAPRVVSHGLVVESLGREGRLLCRRAWVGLVVLLLSLGPGMRHRWIFWQYARIGSDRRTRRRLRQLVRWADVVILEYPFWADAVAPIARQEGRKVVLTAHDILADQIVGMPALRTLAARLERRAWAGADRVVAVSAHDRDRIAEQGVAPILAPNPTDGRLFELDRLGDARAILRDVYAIVPPGDRFCLFVGSRAEPNILAVGTIRTIAAAMPGTGFVVVGGCAEPEQGGNFRALGRVEDAVLLLLYAACALVLVPIPFGTGSSLKTVEGMAAARVVLGTAAAFRGLEVVAGTHGLIEDRLAAYPDRIAAALADAEAARAMGQRARDFARGFDPRVAFRPYLTAIGLHDPAPPADALGAIDATLLAIARAALSAEQPAIAHALAREGMGASPADARAAALLPSDDGLREPDPVDPDPVDPLLRWAVEQEDTWARFRQGEYATVIARAEAVLAEDEQVDDAHLLLARSLHALGREPDRALRHYTLALQCGYPASSVRFGRGRLRRQQGQARLALRDLLLALASRPLSRDLPAMLREALLAVADMASRRRRAGSARSR